jgi:hypothetical protein
LLGLETNIRIFDLKGLSLQPALVGAAGKGASQNLFTYTMAVAVYYQTP